MSEAAFLLLAAVIDLWVGWLVGGLVEVLIGLLVVQVYLT